MAKKSWNRSLGSKTGLLDRNLGSEPRNLGGVPETWAWTPENRKTGAWTPKTGPWAETWGDPRKPVLAKHKKVSREPALSRGVGEVLLIKYHGFWGLFLVQKI